MKLNIFYSHYNTQEALKKARPDWFSFESCLVSLLESIEKSNSTININLILVFDGSKESFYDDFSSKYFSLENVIRSPKMNREVKIIEAGDAITAANLLLDIALNDYAYEAEDLIYTLENDYLHLPGWIEAVQEVIQSQIEFDYLTLYDHADKYRHTAAYEGKYEKLASKIYVTNTRHWRTTPSTCFSFISKFKNLNRDVFYYKKLRDKHVQTVLRLLKRRVLISPIPGFSTHCMSKYLSPLINWERLNTQALKQIDDKSFSDIRGK